jgi:hypothetical protein
MNQHPAPLGIRLQTHWLHETAAQVPPVSRNAVHMLAPQAPGAVVPEAAAQQREHLLSTMLAGEPVIASANEVGS